MSSENNNVYKERQYVIGLIIFLLVVVYSSRLFYLQIIDDKGKISAENSSTKKLVAYPDRGLILDRKGRILVHNEVAYDLLVTPARMTSFDTLSLLSILGIKKEALDKSLEKARRYSYRRSSIVAKQISAKSYAILQESMFKFPGFHVQTRTLRKYPLPIAAHLFGYVGEVSEKKVENDPYYEQGDYIGIIGIEKTYEEYLRGRKGMRIFSIDKFNRILEPYQGGSSDVAPRVGEDIAITIDQELQAYGEKLMQNKIGSIVAIEPQTGEILALVNSPSFDPNLLVGRVRGKNYRMLYADKLLPLYNRALMAEYPPGSTFKLINGLVALEEGVITPASTYTCRHGYIVGNFRMGCHHSHTMALVEAVQLSCNAYFSNYFRRTIDQEEYTTISEGYTQWRNHVTSFGLGRKLNSDLNGEKQGNVPLASFYNKRHGENRWKSLWVVSMGIGQGELLVTPFQMANMTAAIANRGYYIIPHIVKKIGNRDTIPREFTLRNYTTIDPRHFDPIIEGMEKVVLAGTARAAQIPNIAVCGKTGTAENPHGADHSIFTAFAPKDNPKIAISVYVENGGFGSTWAAPIASLMMEKYLTDSISRPHVEERMIKGDLIPEIYKKKQATADSLKLIKKQKGNVSKK